VRKSVQVKASEANNGHGLDLAVARCALGGQFWPILGDSGLVACTSDCIPKPLPTNSGECSLGSESSVPAAQTGHLSFEPAIESTADKVNKTCRRYGTWWNGVSKVDCFRRFHEYFGSN